MRIVPGLLILLAAQVPGQQPASMPAGTASGTLKLALCFGDHMVLQRDRPLRVWGEARPGASVRVALGDQAGEARADPSGRWLVELPARGAATGLRLEVTCEGRRVHLADVLVGDVWLCSGQSNMRWRLRQAAEGKQAIPRANDTGLRFLDFTATRRPGPGKPSLAELQALAKRGLYETRGWRPSTPDVAADFSAVAYFFGQSLRARTGVPTGLVHTAIGGAPIEAFIPAATLRGDPKLAPGVKDWLDNAAYPAWPRRRARENLSAWLAARKGPAPPHPFAPAALFEAGIRPLLGLSFAGVVWYQGEANATRDEAFGRAVDAAVNAHKLRSLISSWRRALEAPELPFLMVQLPGFEREWAPFREAQSEVARSDPRIEFVTTIDVGEPRDIHPRRKQPVGERLARAALGLAGVAELPTGPRLESVKIESKRLRVCFSRTGAGLRSRDGRALRGFAVAGADRRFFPARARIEPAAVICDSPEVPAPRAVRYAWTDDPDVNLVNSADLPCPPFRSDDWPLRPQIRVACIGDSITFGTGLADRRRGAWPAVLGRLLGPDYAVRNFGSPGRGVLKAARRGDGWRAYVKQRAHVRALAWGPDIVICNLGINDCLDFERLGRTAFVSDYRALIHQYRLLPSRPRMLLWTPLMPVGPRHSLHGRPVVGAVEQAIAEVARSSSAITVDMGAPFAGKQAWFPDGLHPDERGARLAADVLAVRIRELR